MPDSIYIKTKGAIKIVPLICIPKKYLLSFGLGQGYYLGQPEIQISQWFAHWDPQISSSDFLATSNLFCGQTSLIGFGFLYLKSKVKSSP